MPVWLSMFLSLGGSTLITLIVTLIFNKLKDGTKNTRDKRKRETREEMRGVIQEENKEIKDKLTSLDVKINTIQSGTQCSLRTAILRSYRECISKGYKTNEDAENMCNLLTAYYALGGNSFVQHTIGPAFDEIKLMSEEEHERTKKEKQILNESHKV